MDVNVRFEEDELEEVTEDVSSPGDLSMAEALAAFFFLRLPVLELLLPRFGVS